MLLAASVDGEAALRHASALAALGPHPWGSPRAAVAAQYVESQFRAAGLSEVRLQPFTSHGVAGQHVLGVLRGSGPEFVVLGAHHDTAPDAPGAYDNGGGVGVLIEAARTLARGRAPARTIVFASWDAEESSSLGHGLALGSRAYVASLGEDASHLVAAFDIEMCGWKGGRPVFHPIAYADPGHPGRYVITPAWLMRAASTSRSFAVGDPLISWLYQPAVRTFRVRLYGDDLSFLQAGRPALFASDSSFTAFYPWYHQAADTADKLDAGALARMGQGVLEVLDALSRAPRGPAVERDWLAVFGFVLGSAELWAIALLSLLPLAWRAQRAGGLALLLAAAQALLFVLLFWRHPVPALWVFLLPNLLGRGRRLWIAALALLPALALAGLGAAAWARGFVGGLWLAPWEVAVLAFGLACALAVGGGARRARASRDGGKPRRRQRRQR
jgi:Peptidase family M28